MDDVIAGFPALRALLEDLAARRVVDADALAAIRIYLQLHCRGCGAVLPESRRQTGESFCLWCGDTTRQAIRRGLELGEDDVPFR